MEHSCGAHTRRTRRTLSDAEAHSDEQRRQSRKSGDDPNSVQRAWRPVVRSRGAGGRVPAVRRLARNEKLPCGWTAGSSTLGVNTRIDTSRALLPVHVLYICSRSVCAMSEEVAGEERSTRLAKEIRGSIAPTDFDLAGYGNDQCDRLAKAAFSTPLPLAATVRLSFGARTARLSPSLGSLSL